ncbi:MAG TPA: serine hydrolase [Methylomirabilota bacterium]|nr:serine hydrolase [Methylomirabilota bacterium]
MRRVALAVLLLVVAGLAIAAAVFRPGKAVRVATGLVSHTLCSETFVAGLDPDQTFAETVRTMPGVRRLVRWLHYRVDRTAREVSTTLGGRFEMRAVYHDGVGCIVALPAPAGPAPPLPSPASAGTPAAAPAPAGAADAPEAGPDIAGPAVVDPASEPLRAALDRVFAEPPGGPVRGTKAVVVVHDGRVVAERYAPGYGLETPMLSWSMNKSVVNALIGVLVRQGRLAIGAPASVPAWRDPSDPRHAITVEQLMRMTSGLALDETNTGFDPSSRMLFLEPDMAGFAESAALAAPPGTRYHYSSPSTLILSRIIRDAVGGRAEDVRRFAERELFAPLGMRGVTLEFDATGTQVGSTYMYAMARDWARFGQLYAADGVAGGRRILPEGWVDYSASPTAGSRDGYAAGFFTNRGESEFARLRVRGGMPADSFFASGTQGQRIVVSPARRLVVVQLGRSQDWETFDIRGLIRLVADVDRALAGPAR